MSPVVHLAFESFGFAVAGMLYWRAANAVSQLSYGEPAIAGHADH
jgi:hypothetical protein